MKAPRPGPCEFGWLVDEFWALLVFFYFFFYCPMAGEWPTLLGFSLMVIFSLPAAILLAILMWFAPSPGNGKKEAAHGKYAQV